VRVGRSLAVGCVVVALTTWFEVGAAWGSYTVTPMCTSGGQTSACTSAWYTSDVSLNWTWSPQDGGNPTSGCVPQSYVKDTSTTVSCTIMGQSGTTIASQPIHVETSSPTVSAVPSRSPDSNDWYNHPVAASVSGRSFSGIAACTSTNYSGPDASSATVGGSCTDNAGKTVSATSSPFPYEASSPTVSVAPSRSPDVNGWYDHPVAASVSGSSFSGIASCASTTYSGPDSSTATVSGGCTDNAGKTASATSSPIRYDGGPPSINVVVDPADRIVLLHWAISDISSARIEIERIPGYRNHASTLLYRGDGDTYRDRRVRDGVSYRYRLIATDQAGNKTIRSFFVTPGPRLLAPTRGTVITAPPMLRWTPVLAASYYNVQLFLGKHKILSAWPTRAGLQLSRRWRFEGHRYRLRPGRYRWYVWPGFGTRRIAHYGRAIGPLTFMVTRAS
jgi:hypothetical protein